MGGGDCMDKQKDEEYDDEIFFPLTTIDKARLYSPRQFSVIIKVFGEKNRTLNPS